MKSEIQQVTFAGLNASEFDMKKKKKSNLPYNDGRGVFAMRPISDSALKGAS